MLIMLGLCRILAVNRLVLIPIYGVNTIAIFAVNRMAAIAKSGAPNRRRYPRSRLPESEPLIGVPGPRIGAANRGSGAPNRRRYPRSRSRKSGR